MVTAEVGACGDGGEVERATAQAEVQSGGSARGRVDAGVKVRGGEEGEGSAASKEVRQGCPRAVLLSRREGRFPISVVGVEIAHDESWGGKLIKKVAVF